ncbi:hypothetical protein SKAU_G00234080 [Synaphobranchus kaupii]|uniref:Uncharacterized protein n=1 Tax=Synaphobranchus kaupii TaxID=118154 RepID=A0A9Q1F661_SYNKA|nr:hypothetical protein SKAU_G00234080 [Synaphobranchus kaupii]
MTTYFLLQNLCDSEDYIMGRYGQACTYRDNHQEEPDSKSDAEEKNSRREEGPSTGETTVVSTASLEADLNPEAMSSRLCTVL